MTQNYSGRRDPPPSQYSNTEGPEIVTARSGRKLAIYYVTVGQHFATVAELRSGATVVATTDEVPYGFTGAAQVLALRLAETL